MVEWRLEYQNCGILLMHNDRHIRNELLVKYIQRAYLVIVV